MKIVFMGTPDFSVGSLDALRNRGHDIVGVFTQPDKPQGRKMQLTPSPVKKYAEEHKIPVFQPQSVKTDETLERIKSLSPDLIAVVAYGKILPESILTLPKYGCVNVHASLLPRHRGASPIQWSIYCGDKDTGVTTMLMDKGMDTGDMLLTAKTPIYDDDNFETLHDRLSALGADLLVTTVDGLEKGNITPKKQPEDGISYAPVIKKEMGLINFKRTADEIDSLIRAFTPWPSAYLFIGEKRVKVLKAVKGGNSAAAAGTVTDTANGLSVACGGNTVITFTELQPEGKGKMSAREFLNGHPVAVGTAL